MGENFLDNHWVFDAGKSLSRERSECIRDRFRRAAAFPAGFDVDTEYTFQASPQGTCFWCAQVMAARLRAVPPYLVRIVMSKKLKRHRCGRQELLLEVDRVPLPF